MAYEFKDGRVIYYFADEALCDLKPKEYARMFDVDNIKAFGKDLKICGGRGQTLLYALGGEDLVFRHYRRGGLWGKLMGDKYSCFTGDCQRALLELELLDILYNDGLPVPKPKIARQVQSGLFVTNDIIIYQIKDSPDLSYVLKERSLSKSELANIGLTLKRFFKYDVVHTDLNVHNILLGPGGKISIIDFDKCKQTMLRSAHKMAMLQRLQRSFEKEKRLDPGFHYNSADFEIIKSRALS